MTLEAGTGTILLAVQFRVIAGDNARGKYRRIRPPTRQFVHQGIIPLFSTQKAIQVPATQNLGGSV